MNNSGSHEKNCTCLRQRQSTMKSSGWATRVLDAFAKPPAGFFDGNTFWLGDYQECRRITVPVPSRDRKYQGKYCNLQIPVQLSQDGTLEDSGGSLLYSCDNSGKAQHKNLTTRQETPSRTGLYNVLFNVSSPALMTVSCHEPQTVGSDPAAIAMIAVSCLFLFIMLLATLYDAFEHQPNLQKYPVKLEKAASVDIGPPQTQQDYYDSLRWFAKALLAFSVYSNGMKLLSVERRPGQLECIHGIRFVSMTWVILGHTYYFAGKYIDNLKEFSKILTEFPTQAILNATVSVDTFFVMSGLLVTYLWLKETEKNMGRNIRSVYHWVMFYVHRYIRLTPVYALILGLDLALYKYLRDGPLWGQQGVEPPKCHHTWWTNIFYLNNLVYQELDNLCFGWSWYLALDMQFHLFAPIMLVMFWYAGYLAIAVATVLLLASCGANGYLQDYYNVAPNALWTLTPSQFNPDPLSGWLYYKDVYIKPWTRVGPYLVGMMVGYALFRVRNKNFKLKNWLNFLCWFTAASVNILVLYGLYGIARGDVSSKGFNAFYEAVNRPAWAAGVAWVIFACVTGNGGFINTILSWNLIFPLSRLTYCAYLIHPLVIMLVYHGSDRAVHFKSHYTMVYYFLAHFAMAYALAAVASLAFESPVLTLEKLIFRKEAPSKAKKRAQNTSNFTTSIPPKIDKVEALIRQYSAVGESVSKGSVAAEKGFSID